MQQPETPIPDTMLSVVEKAVLLKTVEIFSSLPHPVLTHLASLSREQWLGRGAVLFNQGDLGTSMYVIMDGEVAVHDDDRLIATLRRGKIIGELALLTSEVRSTSISALQPSRLLKITQRAMEELLWDHERMRRSLVQVLATRLRNMVSGVQPASG
jgi:CRP-like cAMP-binding protein